ncbi:MAG: CbiX/SirB N-terminal domain-containing protein [Acidobacteriota bacterium]
MSKTRTEKAKVVIVLAVHGAPPLDFPRAELAEFFRLHGGLGHGTGPEQEASRVRYGELEAKMRAWPRTGQNDPFHAGSLELAEHLRRESGLEVIVGFNEFCAPALDEALEQAAAREPEKIIVVTPMMTRGGEHSAVDIPAAINRAQEKHRAVKIIYAWPFPTENVARFLASHVVRLI